MAAGATPARGPGIAPVAPKSPAPCNVCRPGRRSTRLDATRSDLVVEPAPAPAPDSRPCKGRARMAHVGPDASRQCGSCARRALEACRLRARVQVAQSAPVCQLARQRRATGLRARQPDFESAPAEWPLGRMRPPADGRPICWRIAKLVRPR